MYENIYVRSHLEDWFGVVGAVVEEINAVHRRTKHLLDIGCGEGHTTKQILDRVSGSYECDLLEPNGNALVSAEAFLKPENHIRHTVSRSLATFQTETRYDVIFTSHTNYYWALNEVDYRRQLAKLTALLRPGGRLLILTLPERSGHYEVMLRPAYPAFNHAEYIARFYRDQGRKVRIRRLRMRIFVGDMLTTRSRFDLKSFYRFIHNTDSFPDEKEAQAFLRLVRRVQREGYIDFKDWLIVVDA